jgi:5-methyltetrahydrofolate--homocysteine methyltransferase
MNSRIEDLLKERVLVLDGATGTMIQKLRLDEEDFRGKEFKDHSCSIKGNNDCLNISQPESIKAIHREYISAGADIVKTNTFSSNRISMADYDMEEFSYQMAYEGAKIAKDVCNEFERELFVAGSIGPSNRSASMSPDMERPEYRNTSFDEIVEVYSEQITGLLEGGADILLLETFFDTLNAKAVLYACEKVFEKRGEKTPVLLSATITDLAGRTLSGQNIEAFLISIEHSPIISVGLNCSFGAEMLMPHIKTLSEKTSFFTSMHPNAGLPNEFGEYDQTPEMMKEHITKLLENKYVNIVGGCCGTTPKHIQAIVETAKKYSPREI